ncbi:MAG: GatB/YqeY domain-containing protein [Oscillospiraceae bacterium]
MTLIEQVRGEMMAALKAHDTEKKEALSALLAALKAKFIDKRSDLTQEEEQGVVSREVKQLKETIETAPAGYEDVVAKAQKTIEYFSVYLPQQMSEDEIKAAIETVLAALSLTLPTPKEKGIIMKNLMPLTKGKADGKLVNDILATYFK